MVPHVAAGRLGSATVSRWFSGQIAAWLWFTVLFANFAEAVAEGRGKAQADALRRTRTDTMAKRLLMPDERNDLFREGLGARSCSRAIWCWSRQAKSFPPTVKSSKASPRSTNRRSPAKSAPVIRESGGDRSAVTGGTTVLSDWIKVKITAAPGNDLHRPHDRAGRRRGTKEDAQRTRSCRSCWPA